MGKIAVIFGVTGQDGAMLAWWLVAKGYDVVGVMRRSSTDTTERLRKMGILGRIKLCYGDLTDSISIIKILSEHKPDEIYNLAAQSDVKVSFENPEYTANVDGVGTLRILEAMRMVCPNARFYQASTSELYGDTHIRPRNEGTPFKPVSPYAVAKLYAYWITKCYREAYGLFACNGILFNHESPLRGHEFVTRKITRYIAERVAGHTDKPLHLGNLDASRDWGYAADYVVGMWKMLQHDKPGDYVLATGKTHTVREFLEEAFKTVKVDLRFDDDGCAVYAKHSSNPAIKKGDLLVVTDSQYLRPHEVPCLLGDASKARKELDWQPEHDFKWLVKEMVTSDMQEARNGR